MTCHVDFVINEHIADASRRWTNPEIHCTAKDVRLFMNVRSLLNKRVVFISGKGGVGKTSVSILLALMAARLKKRAIVVEMNSSGRVAPIFGKTHELHKEILLGSGISSINLSPEKCIEEYVVRHIHFRQIYRTFIDNKYVTNLLYAIPGHFEAMMLGKIKDLEAEKTAKKSVRSKYDLIVVDAPATGHGLSILEVPAILKAAVTIGPLFTLSSEILDLFADHERTAFSLVTLAEEMPICESEEYLQAVREKTELGFGPLFVNSVMPPVREIASKGGLPGELGAFWDFYSLARERANLNRTYLEEIDRRFEDLTRIVIPFQFRELNNPEAFEPIMDLLMEPDD